MGNPTRTGTLVQFRKWLGTKEIPDGSNRTPIGVRFGWNGQPWCAEKVYVALHDAGWNIPKSAGAYDLGQRLSELPGWQRVKPSELKSGDVCVFVFSHIGMVESRRDANTVVTLEGNHNNADQRVVRSINSIQYGVRPPYSPEVAKPAKSKGTRKAKVIKDYAITKVQKWDGSKWVDAPHDHPVAGHGGTVVVELYSHGDARVHWGHYRGHMPSDHLKPIKAA